jgi:hypothetical protein
MMALNRVGLWLNEIWKSRWRRRVGLWLNEIWKSRWRRKLGQYATARQTAFPFWLWCAFFGVAIALSLLDIFRNCFYSVWSIAALAGTALYGVFFYVNIYNQKLDTLVSQYARYGREIPEGLSHKKAGFTLVFSGLLIVALTLVAMVLPAVDLLKVVTDTVSGQKYVAGTIGEMLDSTPMKIISALASVGILLVFTYCDLYLAKFEGPDWRNNEFLSYAALADGPAAITMGILAGIYLGIFNDAQQPSDAFYAGASAFQFIGFNIAFTIIGIMNVDLPPEKATEGEGLAPVTYQRS